MFLVRSLVVSAQIECLLISSLPKGGCCSPPQLAPSHVGEAGVHQNNSSRSKLQNFPMFRSSTEPKLARWTSAPPCWSSQALKDRFFPSPLISQDAVRLVFSKSLRQSLRFGKLQVIPVAEHFDHRQLLHLVSSGLIINILSPFG